MSLHAGQDPPQSLVGSQATLSCKRRPVDPSRGGGGPGPGPGPPPPPSPMVGSALSPPSPMVGSALSPSRSWYPSRSLPPAPPSGPTPPSDGPPPGATRVDQNVAIEILTLVQPSSSRAHLLLVVHLRPLTGNPAGNRRRNPRHPLPEPNPR